MGRALVLLLAAALAGCGARDTRRYVFIDGGAHQGESHTAFQKCRMDPEHRWETCAVEANPGSSPGCPRPPT